MTDARQTPEDSVIKHVREQHNEALAVADHAGGIDDRVMPAHECAELIDRVRSASCAGSLSDLDRHVVRLFADDKE